MSAWDLQIVVDGVDVFRKDAADPRRVPEGIRFSTSWQGGDKELSWNGLQMHGEGGIGRPFADVKVISNGGADVEFEGEQRRLGRSSAGMGVERLAPLVRGYAVRFEGNPASFLGIDRSLSNWQGASNERQLGIIDIPLRPRDGEVRDGGLRLDVSGAWETNNGRPWASMMYDASPLQVGRVLWQSATAKNMHGGVWNITVGALDGNPDIDFRVIAADGDQGPGDFTINSPRVELAAYTGLGAATEQARTYDFGDVVVTGGHGLELVGNGPYNYGLRATDIWAYIVTNFVYGLEPGTMWVESPELTIQHFVERMQTPGAIWNNVNAYHGNAWDVRGMRVNCYPFGGRRDSRTWLVRTDDPRYVVDEEGLDADEAWSGVVVSYTTPTGEPRTVGPPGQQAHTHHELLEITDPWHPAVAAGIPRIKPLNMDVPTDEATAVAYGAMWLREVAARKRKGKVQITGLVWDSEGRAWPSFKVRGGDFVQIVDGDDPSPIRVLETQYDDDTLTVTADFDDEEQRHASFLAHLINRTTGKV